MHAHPPPGTFLNEMLVECPRCSERAIVGTAADGLRMTCSHCGCVLGTTHASQLAFGSVRQDGRDTVFDLPLWLTTECCGGNVLWALNEPHLSYLERFVASSQRDRDFPSPAGARSLTSTLPKWMQPASNREELLRAIARLRQRLA